MYKLIIHPDAKADIANLWLIDVDAAAEVAAWLDEAAGSQLILDSLTDHGFGENQADARYSISRWQEHYRRGKNLWRARVFAVNDFRIIYCYTPLGREYHVLGVINREFNYDGNDERTQRVLRAYENL